jgi:2-polyprenyl-3-methyl-5-hydroxy-6-metoxy-1,4-benzoquinol methylase
VHHDCACGSADDELFATRDRFGIAMNTVICRRCGLVRTDPTLTDAAYSAFYEDEFLKLFGSQYGERTGTLAQIHEEEKRKGEVIYRTHFAALLQGAPSVRVADIGCGTGGVLSVFAAHGHTASGCDVNSQTCAYGREMGLNTIAGGVDALKSDGPFDIVILNHVLEHVTEPNMFLESIASIMRGGGYLYIALPSIMDLSWDRYRWDVLRFLRFYHPYSYCMGTLSSVVARHRFRLVNGNEWIQAVFQYHGPEGEVPEQRNYYAEVKRYLRRVEVRRQFVRLKSIFTLRLA